MEICCMKMLQPGDKIDRMSAGDIIYTMIVKRVTEDKAFAVIPGGTDETVLLRQHEGPVLEHITPVNEGWFRYREHICVGEQAQGS